MKILRNKRTRLVLVPVMAVSVLSACSFWKVQDMTPSQVVAEKEPSQVRVTTLDGDKIQISDPTVTDGEIVGHPMRNAGGHYRAVRSDTLRVSIDSVTRIEIRETSAGASVVAVLLGLVAVGIGLVVGFCSSGCVY